MELRPIPDFPGYSVREDGAVISRRLGRPMRPSLSNQGAHRVILYGLDERAKTMLVHRLVAQAFQPNPENKPEVNHKDGNRQNNHRDNLEWATPTENMKHAYRTGLAPSRHGAANGRSLLTEQAALAIAAAGQSREARKALAKQYGVSFSTIKQVQNGQHWALRSPAEKTYMDLVLDGSLPATFD